MSFARTILLSLILAPLLGSCQLMRPTQKVIDGCQAAAAVQDGVNWKALLQTAEVAQKALHYLADVSIAELRDNPSKAERARELVTVARDHWRRMESFGFDDPVTVPTAPWIGGGIAHKHCTLRQFDGIRVELLIEYIGERGHVANVRVHTIRSARGKLMFAGTIPQEPYASLLKTDDVDIERLVSQIMRH
jgi:hypothetical protein